MLYVREGNKLPVQDPLCCTYGKEAFGSLIVDCHDFDMFHYSDRMSLSLMLSKGRGKLSLFVVLLKARLQKFRRRVKKGLGSLLYLTAYI